MGNSHRRREAAQRHRIWEGSEHLRSSPRPGFHPHLQVQVVRRLCWGGGGGVKGVCQSLGSIEVKLQFLNSTKCITDADANNDLEVAKVVK